MVEAQEVPEVMMERVASTVGLETVGEMIWEKMPAEEAGEMVISEERRRGDVATLEGGR